MIGCGSDLQELGVDRYTLNPSTSILQHALKSIIVVTRASPAESLATIFKLFHSRLVFNQSNGCNLLVAWTDVSPSTSVLGRNGSLIKHEQSAMQVLCSHVSIGASVSFKDFVM
jgi:hypothetical protein